MAQWTTTWLAASGLALLGAGFAAMALMHVAGDAPAVPATRLADQGAWLPVLAWTAAAMGASTLLLGAALGVRPRPAP